MKNQQKGAIAPRVRVEEYDEPEFVNTYRLGAVPGLPAPRTVTVTLPRTNRRGVSDAITVRLCEGEWDHRYIHLSGEVKSGLQDAPLDGGHIVDGCIRSDQLERLILALQHAMAEADKLGLRTPRGPLLALPVHDA